MNDEDAMSFFAGRRPSFSSGGKLRGFRSRPGAPQANSARLSGKSTTPDSAWNKWFPDAGRAERTGAPQYPVNFLGKIMDSGPMQGAAAEIQQAYDETQKSPLERSVEKHDKIIGAAGPVGNGGIAGQTLDAAFGAGYWNRLVGRGQWSTPPPMDTVTGTQGMTRRVTGLPLGQFATASFVPGQNSPANLAKRKNPLSWGGIFGRNG